MKSPTPIYFLLLVHAGACAANGADSHEIAEFPAWQATVDASASNVDSGELNPSVIPPTGANDPTSPVGSGSSGSFGSPQSSGSPENSSSSGQSSFQPGAQGMTSVPRNPLLPSGEAVNGWTWIAVDGAFCRDGSPAGYLYREGQADNLLIFLNGGGACSDPYFCGLNPSNVHQNLPSETLLAATGNLIVGPDPSPQTPPEDGVLKQDPTNPVGDWNMVYIPYCTGDVHGGQNPDGQVPGVDGTQKFVGYTNMGLFLQSFGPAFSKAKKVILSGSSAGSFGAALNFDRTQKYFDPQGAKVYAILDSGLTFRDPFLEVCLQERWRELWKLNASLPSDCSDCFHADGGGLGDGLTRYLFRDKYPARGGIISSNQDEVIKLFFSAGLSNCTYNAGLAAFAAAFGVWDYPQDRYPDGLKDSVENVSGDDNFSSYFMQDTRHMHLWRARYFEENGTGMTIADWLKNVISEQVTHAGSL